MQCKFMLPDGCLDLVRPPCIVHAKAHLLPMTLRAGLGWSGSLGHLQLASYLLEIWLSLIWVAAPFPVRLHRPGVFPGDQIYVSYASGLAWGLKSVVTLPCAGHRVTLSHGHRCWHGLPALPGRAAR